MIAIITREDDAQLEINCMCVREVIKKSNHVVVKIIGDTEPLYLHDDQCAQFLDTWNEYVDRVNSVWDRPAKPPESLFEPV
jgi:predicted double-glycine peptidase